MHNNLIAQKDVKKPLKNMFTESLKKMKNRN